MIMQHWVRVKERQKLSLWLFCTNAGVSHSPAFPTQKHCFCSSGKLIVPDELSSSCVFTLHCVYVYDSQREAVITGPLAGSGFVSE